MASLFDNPRMGDLRVPEYPAYVIGRDGHFISVIDLVCANDAEAIQRARQLVDGHAIELWQADRKVAQFEPLR